MKNTFLSEQATSTRPVEDLAVVGAIARIPLILKANPLKVLRLVAAGDPYRDKAPGRKGAVARTRSLAKLETWKLVRRTREGLWRVTPHGKRCIAFNLKRN
jgi:hypothetical protein